MADAKKMEAAVHAYVDGFARGDLDAIVALFADNATAEDPVGTPPNKGKDAIRTFYGNSLKTGAKLTLEGPIRLIESAGYAVFPFSVAVSMDGHAVRIDVIDTFRFNEENKVVEMRAFFGPANISPA